MDLAISQLDSCEQKVLTSTDGVICSTQIRSQILHSVYYYWEKRHVEILFT